MADYENGSAPEAEAEGPKHEQDELFERLKCWFKDDRPKANDWREEAEEAFKFRDGDQYTDEEKRALQDQMRPVVVFNRTGVLIDAVVGSEINNRREVRYIPREEGDSQANEVLTSAAEWFRDQCDAEDEESEAFKDTVTAGMGWTETRIDYDRNPNGEPVIERIDPFEMVWDCDAVKANLVDARRLWRVREMDCKAAQKLFPDVDEEDLDAAWAREDDEEGRDPIDASSRNRYIKQDGEREPGSKRKVTIIACQYKEEEAYFRVLIAPPMADPMQPPPPPQEAELSEAEFKAAQAQGVQIVKAVRLTRSVVKQAFLGRRMLKEPVSTQTGMFQWACVTGLHDKDKGFFYGIVRRAMDPQRWANKWLSQMMHILNSQAKGGILAEAGVFEDPRKAERDWAKPNSIVELSEGALSGPNGPKWTPKPVAQFPAGFDRLLQYADENIVKATGINMELLGMRDANQPGVLEMQRRQSGITILATFFDALRRYRKIQGRVLLKLIQTFLMDGRLVRIVGQGREQYVPLVEQAEAEYDIIVDDAPSSPNEKERTWGILQQMLPMLKDQIGPEEMLAMAEYSPLPPSLVEKLKKGAEAKAAQAQEPDPMMEAQRQIEEGKLQLEAQKLQNEQVKMQLEMAKLQIESKKLDVEMRKIQSDEMIGAMNANVAAAEASRPVIQTVR